MGASTSCDMRRCYCSLLALLLCFQFLRPSQGFKLRGGYVEEKVPLTVIVPDPSPELSPLAAPPPVSGADGDMRPRLPKERGRGEERRGAHAPAAAPARAPALAGAPAPDSGSGTASIRSSPAVQVPRGVTDTATILPMPAPGNKWQDAGAAPTTLVRAGVVPVAVGFIMMASFGALR